MGFNSGFKGLKYLNDFTIKLMDQIIFILPNNKETTKTIIKIPPHHHYTKNMQECKPVRQE
jgi:hypothetical protein